MQIKRFFNSGLAINSYLIWDEDSKLAAMIDPTREINPYLKLISENKLTLKDILETHVHADFVSGSRDLKAALDGKPIIHCSGMGGKEWIPPYADHVVQDRDRILLGLLQLEARHTPGHTPEHLIWVVYDGKRSVTIPCVVFTGDLLFVGSVGRPDLLGDQQTETLTKQLYQSLFGVLQEFPEFVEFFPGHGAGSLCGKEIGNRESSTLGYERRCNPLLMPQSYAQWHKRLSEGMPCIPPYFSRMKKVNVSEASSRINTDLPILTQDSLSKASATLVDARSPEAFAVRHLKGSINIPIAPNFPAWAGAVLASTKDIILIVETPKDVEAAMIGLGMVGLDSKVRGVCLSSQWQLAGQEAMFTDLKTLSPEEVFKNKDLYILDVRTPSEWHAGHIEGAHHLELNCLVAGLKELPKDKQIATICRSGMRASVAASLLEQAGFKSPINVKGGMVAWTKANLPINPMDTM